MPTPTRVADRYIPLRLLGEGGAGRVWLVEDRLRPGAYCALKELTSGGADREAAFRREYATLSQLKHPSLVEAWEFDVAPESGLPRFTLEFVEGDNAVAPVRSEGIETFFTVATEALRALAFPKALIEANRMVEGAELVRELWRKDDFGQETESRVLETFPELIEAADHRARSARLLYEEEWTSALRVAGKGGADWARLAKARVAAAAAPARARSSRAQCGRRSRGP